MHWQGATCYGITVDDMADHDDDDDDGDDDYNNNMAIK
jgi:hypothetical protein